VDGNAATILASITWKQTCECTRSEAISSSNARTQTLMPSIFRQPSRRGKIVGGKLKNFGANSPPKDQRELSECQVLLRMSGLSDVTNGNCEGSV
jgi:hypothetical protein